MKNKITAASLIMILSFAVVTNFFLNTLVLAQAIGPNLPQVYVDSSYPSLSSNHTIWSVQNSCSGVTNCFTSVQSAVNAANPGDEIALRAGQTFTGKITLPAKSCNVSSCWIVIRSSNLSSLPSSGSRVSPSDAANMPKILSPGFGDPALVAAPGSSYYRISGIEFAKVSPAAVTYELLSLGNNDSTQTTLSQVPSHIIVDRDYIHGDSTSDLKRGVGLNSSASAVVDSYISDIHVIGQDAQAIASFNTPGQIKIFNNYLEASTENVMFGGSDPMIVNLAPADIEVRKNYFYKPMSWKVGDPTYGGHHWSVKNIFELKNAKRVIVDGNIFENNWSDGQIGTAIVFTPRNQDGGCTGCMISDITFSNNIVRHSASAVTILGHDYLHPSGTTGPIKIENNSFEDINGSTYGGSGWFVSLQNGTSEAGPDNVQIIHNTVNETGNMLDLAGSVNNTFITKNNLVFTDNIINHNAYGIKGDNDGSDDVTIAHYLPGAVVTNNVIVGGNANAYAQHSGNFFPATWPTTNQYPNVGVDTTKLDAALAGVFSPSANATNPTPAPAPAPAPTPSPAPAPAPAPSPSPVAPTTSTVLSFGIIPLTVDEGQGFVASFSASSQNNFVSAQLWRSLVNSTDCAASNRSGCVWSQTQTLAAPSSTTTWNGSINDSAPVGSYWYGVHVMDVAHVIQFEPKLIQVTVSTPTVVSPSPLISVVIDNTSTVTPSIDTGSIGGGGGSTSIGSSGSSTGGGGGGSLSMSPVAPPVNSVNLPSDQSTYADGTLLIDKGVIYIMEYSKKRPFASMAVMNGLSYQLSQAKTVDTTGIPEGPGIFTSKIRHTRGTVVNDAGTLYFMGASLRYPFPSAAVYFSWNHTFAEAVPANSYDKAVPIGLVILTK